nr:BofC C-terminal domain-containing protein [Paenibacillus caui]
MRRRLRRWRRAIWTITACAVVFAMVCLEMPLSDQLKNLLTQDEPAALETLATLKEWAAENEQSNFEAAISRTDQPRIVHTGKVYVCGEENKIIGILKPNEILELLSRHPNWQGRLDDEGEVWLEEHVAELSETCKRKGYIGLDSTGSLSLFEGKPDKEKVMRTFFQIDIKSMETALPKEVIKQLHDGIRIQDLEEYNSVLSTFSDFAVGPAEKTKH